MKRQAILFLIDTQGTNCIGAYAGNPALRTSHLDRLAAESVRFARAHTCSPVCGPARSAIFTGVFPHANGVLGNNQAPHADLPTLGQRLQRAGLHAGYIGKWHLDGTDYFGDGRCPAGWDPACWFDGRNYLDSLGDDDARDRSRRVLSPADVARHRLTAEFTHAHRTVDRAIDFLRRHRDEDFLLVVSIDEPHGPFICPEPFVSSFEDFLLEVPNADDPLIDKPQGQRDWADFALASGDRDRLVRRNGRTYYRHPAYFACNSFSDSEVGRVLGAISSETPDALTIYTSDHGDLFQSHRLHGKGPAMYDEITRVPLMIRWPGHTPRGAVSEAPVSHIDLVPTLLAYFGLPVPDLLQGRSLLEQVRDPTVRTHEHVFIEFNRYEVDHDGFGGFVPIRCVCDGRWKLAVNLLDTDELYDLATDSHELRNRIADPATATIRDTLHDALLDWMNVTRDPLRGPPWSHRPWREIRRPSWGGPTRPRRFDEAFHPKTRLYTTGRDAHTYEFDKP